jgi:hypothetical protein
MLVPYMPVEYFSQLWIVVQEMPNDWALWQILEALAKYVPEDFLDLFLLRVQMITDEVRRTQVLEMLIPQVMEEHFFLLWDVIRGVHGSLHMERLLVALAPYIPERYISRLWRSVPGILDDKRRVQVLCVLFPHLSTEKIAESLEMMRDVPMGTTQLEMFEALLPYLSEAQCMEILDSLLPKPPDQLGDVLMQATWDKRYHMRTLAVLVPYLPEKQIVATVPILLMALKVLNVEEDQFWIIKKLVSNLTTESLAAILDQLLEALKTIDVYFYVQVFEAMLPVLVPDGWKKSLAWAMKELQATGNTYVAVQILKSAQSLSEESISTLFYPFVHEILHRLSQSTRSEVLPELTQLIPVVYGIGGEDAVLKICCSMLEIGSWWP